MVKNTTNKNSVRTKKRTYQKHKKINMVSHQYTRKQKRKVVEELFYKRPEDVVDEFEKLKIISCDKSRAFGKVGNDVVNYFTLEERLETIGNKGVSFYDVWNNRAKISTEYPYIRKVLTHYKKNYNTYPEIKVWKRIYDLYYGSITLFRPLQAMEVYCKFKPTTVLDFTMGWGGRLIGACALDIDHYIGIDNNMRLKTPYENMVKMLKPLSKTKIDLYFEDALKVDYSKLKYDMVLTSPPYYNTEIYANTIDLTKEKWNTEFYAPLFEKTFKHLQPGGHYCLNISKEIYDKVGKSVLGACKMKIPMKKFKRTTGKPYEEYIYVWIK
jgi:16S rRNA G966 N2-methylase RsmD